jgi:hypothetical protein
MVAAAGYVGFMRVVRRVTNVIPEVGRVLALHRKKRERHDFDLIMLPWR